MEAQEFNISALLHSILVEVFLCVCFFFSVSVTMVNFVKKNQGF